MMQRRKVVSGSLCQQQSTSLQLGNILLRSLCLSVEQILYSDDWISQHDAAAVHNSKSLVQAPVSRNPMQSPWPSCKFWRLPLEYDLEA